MTHAAAVIGLTFNGTDLQQNPPGLFLEIVVGLNEPPSVRGTDTIVPALDGRIPRNRVVDTRFIELRGWVAGIGATEALQRASFRTQVKALLALFNPSADPDDLVADLEDGTTGTISAQTTNIIWGPLRVPAMRTLSIELESTDPEWVYGS